MIYTINSYVRTVGQTNNLRREALQVYLEIASSMASDYRRAYSMDEAQADLELARLDEEDKQQVSEALIELEAALLDVPLDMPLEYLEVADCEPMIKHARAWFAGVSV